MDRVPDSEVPENFKPGFRFSVSDGAILATGIVAAWLLRQSAPWLAFAVMYVVGHFFLFCNVFRISRPLELIWASVFLVSACAAAVGCIPAWPHALSASLITTVTVIGIGLRQPSYHGVGWQWVNPKLLDWWSLRQDTRP